MKTNPFITHFVAIGAALAVAGCATAPQPSVKYVNPGAPGGVAGTGIESQDIGAAAQKAAVSILALPAIANATNPPTILITPVTNTVTSMQYVQVIALNDDGRPLGVSATVPVGS